ncbi:hypothetical protein MTsPCn9_13240 [Croceitalea sp. MTPC9]|uniref:hypothetical protein n=1 Tax=unclassified Croceitalea TaxID=2632280 RepID=UPI002B3BBF8C|nr:hypothetical protein MTsPCn6_15890 [Croceitalea sp. MTPC6]GMN16388.1 hypothetical protein MTsPCn9_13240 [Croceitalea sp. MTPC9]
MDYKNHLEKRMAHKAEYYVTKVVKIFFFIILGIAFLLLMNYVFMLLWNWLMPELFGLPTIGYWKALGLIVLAKIIFGFGFGDSDGPSGKKRKRKKRFEKNKCNWRNDFSDWKHYDAFWKEEGEKAYQDYINRTENENKA